MEINNTPYRASKKKATPVGSFLFIVLIGCFYSNDVWAVELGNKLKSGNSFYKKLSLPKRDEISILDCRTVKVGLGIDQRRVSVSVEEAIKSIPCVDPNAMPAKAFVQSRPIFRQKNGYYTSDKEGRLDVEFIAEDIRTYGPIQIQIENQIRRVTKSPIQEVQSSGKTASKQTFRVDATEKSVTRSQELFERLPKKRPLPTFEQEMPPIGQSGQYPFIDNGETAKDSKKKFRNKKNILPLYLNKALLVTLKNNIDIDVQKYFPRINEQAIVTNDGEFDPVLSGEVSADENATASAFTATKNRTDNQAWSLKASQTLYPGTNYVVDFNNRRTNDSLGSLLDPSIASDLSLTVTQPLLRNFGTDVNKTQIYIASNNKKISDYDFTNRVIDILSQTEIAYLDLVRNIQNYRVTARSLQLAKDLLVKAGLQIDEGALPAVERLQPMSDIAVRTQQLINSRNFIKDFEDTLKNVMNLDLTGVDGQKSILPLDAPQVPTQWKMTQAEALKIAFAMRPDYLAQKKELENRKIQVKFNENQIYPTVDLFGSMGLNGLAGNATTGETAFDGNYFDTLGEVTDADTYSWKVGVQLRYRLGNRIRKSRLNSSRLEVERFLKSVKSLERRIIVEVRQALRQVVTDIDRVQASRMARELAEEKLKAEEEKFEAGISTSFTVLRFQQDLLRDQTTEIQAVVDYNQSLVRLRQSLGNTLEHHKIQLANQEGY